MQFANNIQFYPPLSTELNCISWFLYGFNYFFLKWIISPSNEFTFMLKHFVIYCICETFNFRFLWHKQLTVFKAAVSSFNCLWVITRTEHLGRFWWITGVRNTPLLLSHSGLEDIYCHFKTWSILTAEPFSDLERIWDLLPKTIKRKWALGGWLCG